MVGWEGEQLFHQKTALLHTLQQLEREEAVCARGRACATSRSWTWILALPARWQSWVIFLVLLDFSTQCPVHKVKIIPLSHGELGVQWSCIECPEDCLAVGRLSKWQLLLAGLKRWQESPLSCALWLEPGCGLGSVTRWELAVGREGRVPLAFTSL